MDTLSTFLCISSFSNIIFVSYKKKKVGNGQRIRFWEDVWLGEQAFSPRFPDLYRLSLAQNCNVAELFVHQTDTTFHGWDLNFYRNLHAREIHNFATLSAILDQVRLNGELEDLKI